MDGFLQLVFQIYYQCSAIPKESADELFESLEQLEFQQGRVKVHGKVWDEPRTQLFFADNAGAKYTYSGKDSIAVGWTPELLQLKQTVEELTGATYNCAIVNKYVGGRQKIGMHADDEKSLEPGSYIASVSVGQIRKFVVQSTTDTKKRYVLRLFHGDLLVMTTQDGFKHGVPEEARVTGTRYNITFRKLRM